MSAVSALPVIDLTGYKTATNYRLAQSLMALGLFLFIRLLLLLKRLFSKSTWCLLGDAGEFPMEVRFGLKACL